MLTRWSRVDAVDPSRSPFAAVHRGTPGAPRPAQREVLERLDLSYDAVGASTRSPLPPAGWGEASVIQRAVLVGRGRETFMHLRAALFGWEIHEGAGIAPVGRPEIRVGIDVPLRAGIGPVGLVSVCRVVDVIDEERRAGFTYGTTSLHPESGEELFLVEWLDDDNVRFSLRGFSRRNDLVPLVAAPLLRTAQRWYTQRYLTVAESLAAGIERRPSRHLHPA